MTRIKLGNISFKPRGEYNKNITYSIRDCVSFEGNCFIAMKDIPINITPVNNEYWMEVNNYNTLYANLKNQVDSYNKDISEIKEKYEDIISKSDNVVVSSENIENDTVNLNAAIQKYDTVILKGDFTLNNLILRSGVTLNCIDSSININKTIDMTDISNVKLNNITINYTGLNVALKMYSSHNNTITGKITFNYGNDIIGVLLERSYYNNINLSISCNSIKDSNGFLIYDGIGYKCCLANSNTITGDLKCLNRGFYIFNSQLLTISINSEHIHKHVEIQTSNNYSSSDEFLNTNSCDNIQLSGYFETHYKINEEDNYKYTSPFNEDDFYIKIGKNVRRTLINNVYLTETKKFKSFIDEGYLTTISNLGGYNRKYQNNISKQFIFNSNLQLKCEKGVPIGILLDDSVEILNTSNNFSCILNKNQTIHFVFTGIKAFATCYSIMGNTNKKVKIGFRDNWIGGRDIFKIEKIFNESVLEGDMFGDGGSSITYKGIYEIYIQGIEDNTNVNLDSILGLNSKRFMNFIDIENMTTPLIINSNCIDNSSENTFTNINDIIGNIYNYPQNKYIYKNNKALKLQLNRFNLSDDLIETESNDIIHLINSNVNKGTYAISYSVFIDESYHNKPIELYFQGKRDLNQFVDVRVAITGVQDSSINKIYSLSGNYYQPIKISTKTGNNNEIKIYLSIDIKSDSITCNAYFKNIYLIFDGVIGTKISKQPPVGNYIIGDSYYNDFSISQNIYKWIYTREGWKTVTI